MKPKSWIYSKTSIFLCFFIILHKITNNINIIIDKNIIIDLRDNGGGYMDVLSEVTGMLVEPQGSKQTISIAVDKNGKEKSFYSKNQISFTIKVYSHIKLELIKIINLY